MGGLIVIGGPTGSGKSALALRLARQLDGTIVNADSMQMYRELRTLTARPTPAEEASVPHHLYGTLPADEVSSAGRWLELAETVIDRVTTAGRVVIVVGGTGLYLHALLHGIAPVPPIPPIVRTVTRRRFDELGGAAFHAELARHDPVMAARLRPSDRQRLMRAAEVYAATGRSLAEWQQQPTRRVALPEPWCGFALAPPRAELRARIASRLQGMIDAGALAEVEVLHARRLDSDLPIMKAVAVPELLAHIEGRLDLAAALERATNKTRQYAKRQLTWLRHQLPELERITHFGDSPQALPDIDALRRILLTDRRLKHSVRTAQ